MADLHVNHELLKQFERGLDPRFPERNAIPTKVLGYGEISTVLEIDTGSDADLVYKRMPMFRTEQEAQTYAALHRDYIQVLTQRIGLQVAPSDMVRIVDEQKGRVIVYIVQEKLPSEAIGHRAIRHMPAGDERARPGRAQRNRKGV